MYTYIKKALLVLSLLAIPCMNSASQALLEDEHDTIFRGQQLMAQAQQNEGETQTSWVSWVTSCVKRASQATIDGIDSVPSLGGRVVYKGLNLVLSNKEIATGCGVLYFASSVLGACYCTCAGDGTLQKCGWIGLVEDNNTCYSRCFNAGQFKHYICVTPRK